MAALPSPLSLQEYLQTSYKPDVDFVDGGIEERNVGKFEHSTFQAAIVSYFWTRRREWAIRPMTEQRIRVSASRIRVCDVLVQRAEAPREEVTLTPPLICIEILSPEDRLSRAKLVLGDYLAMGVSNVWLIDPIYRAAFVFDAAGLHDADPLHLAVPGTLISLDLSEAFAAIE